jgi:hypothetical protein
MGERGLRGRDGWFWRVIRTDNACVFREPKAAASQQLFLSPIKTTALIQATLGKFVGNCGRISLPKHL